MVYGLRPDWRLVGHCYKARQPADREGIEHRSIEQATTVSFLPPLSLPLGVDRLLYCCYNTCTIITMIYRSNSSKWLKQGPPKAMAGDVFALEEPMDASLSFFTIDL
jgi:hypothetical protein